MPTNLFDDSSSLRTRMSRNLGFDPSSMIQSQYPQIMQDVEERRQMGRKKFSEDILQQQLAAAAQELQNRAAGYHLTQEQQYYNNPATSKMFQDYLKRMGFDTNATIGNPHQIADLHALTSQALSQEQSKERLGEHMLQSQYPAAPSDIEWARKMVGAPSVPAKPPPDAPVKPPYTGRGPLSIFLNKALPPGIGTAGSIAAGSRTPGPWPVKAAVGVGTYFLGDTLARMQMGDLTPEEEAEHPWASGLGEAVGYIGGALGGKKIAGKGSGSLGGGATLMPGMIRIRGGGGQPAPGGVKVKGGGFKENLMNMFRSQPKPAVPVQPASGFSPSTGNVPVPPIIPNPQTPTFTDPALQKFIQQYFKKVQSPPPMP